MLAELLGREPITLPAPKLTSPVVTASRVAHGRNVLTSSAGSGLLAIMKEVFYIVSIHISTVLTGHGLLQTRWGAVSSRLNLLSTMVRHTFQAGSQMLRFKKQPYLDKKESTHLNSFTTKINNKAIHNNFITNTSK